MGYDGAQLDMENILQTMDAKDKLEKGINVMRKLLRLHLKGDAEIRQSKNLHLPALPLIRSVVCR